MRARTDAPRILNSPAAIGSVKRLGPALPGFT
jgi:hypothetical protein